MRRPSFELTIPKSNSNHETTQLKIRKSIYGEIRKLEKSLAFSKEDIDLYSNILLTILQKDASTEVTAKARLFLVKQLKLKEILRDLTTRQQSLGNHWKSYPPSNIPTHSEITRQLSQLVEEVRIFHEIHFSVKRTYLRFAHEQFQLGSRQPLMVA